MDKGAKILIAGAGIGGLAAAACLMTRGFQVEVHEQSPALGEVGAGIQLSANAVKVLDFLGLRAEIERVGVRSQAFEYRRFDTGELLHRLPLGARHEELHHAPYYHIHRADIHDILARRVLSLDPGCIHLGHRVTGYVEDADGVTLSFADGTKTRGAVLIGADGIKSAVRAQLLGATPAHYTGHVAWRATIPAERLPADYMERVATVWCGPKNHAVVYYLCSGRVVNFVGCVEREAWEEESWTSKRPWEELKADYAGWHPKVQMLIDAMDKESCYRWALNNRAPILHWSTPRVTLMGDAAHPTLPYLASGAVMAIEDAAVLSRALEREADPAAALDLFQRNRVERTARVVNESTEHGDLYHIMDAAEMKRAFEEKNIAKSRNEWLYCYDPIHVPLV